MTRPCLFAFMLLANMTIVSAAPVVTVRSGGDGAISVVPGESIDLDVELSGMDAELAVSASFEITFDVSGFQYDAYQWTLPFATGGGDDQSQPSLSALPAIITDDLFGSAGSTVDVHFDNFSSSGGVGNGLLTSLTVIVPADLPPSSSVSIAAVPGEFVFTDSPFAETPDAGSPLVLNISAGTVVDVEIRTVQQPTVSQQGILPDGDGSACAEGAFFVEIWVSQIDGGVDGVAGGSIDLLFDNTRLNVDAIDHGDFYVEQTTGTIDNAFGIVTGLGGFTSNTSMGVAPQWAMLARASVVAVATGETQVSIAPGPIPFAISSGQPPLDNKTQVTLGVPQEITVTVPIRPGDANCDDDVDLSDFASLQRCLTTFGLLGDTPGFEPGCSNLDLNADNDVNLLDFGILQANFDIPGVTGGG